MSSSVEPGMHERVRSWMVQVLQSHLPLVALAVRQRAKFEHWLKFELAWHAVTQGAVNVEVEARPEGYAGRSDVAFTFDGFRYDVELKTIPTNYRTDGVAVKTRTITMDLTATVDAARKLQTCPGKGLVGFVLFPVRCTESNWETYLNTIGAGVGTSLNVNDHCQRLTLPLGDGYDCEVVVCCFPWPVQASGSSLKSEAALQAVLIEEG